MYDGGEVECRCAKPDIMDMACRMELQLVLYKVIMIRNTTLHTMEKAVFKLLMVICISHHNWQWYTIVSCSSIFKAGNQDRQQCRKLG